MSADVFSLKTKGLRAALSVFWTAGFPGPERKRTALVKTENAGSGMRSALAAKPVDALGLRCCKKYVFSFIAFKNKIFQGLAGIV